MNTAFGIALTGLLLEHEWPVDITRLIQQVHDALVSNDAECITRASRVAYAAAYAAAHTINHTTTTAAYATYAAAAAATAYAAANYTADFATSAADYTARAADYAIRALPDEATRIRALHTLLTQ